MTQLAQRITEAGVPFEWPIEKEKGPRDHSRIVETMNESLRRARKTAEELDVDTTGTRRMI